MPAGVQPVGRFVEHKHRRITDERRRQTEVPHAQRVAADRPTSCVRQADQRQRRVGGTVGVTVHGAVDPQMIPPAAAGESWWPRAQHRPRQPDGRGPHAVPAGHQPRSDVVEGSGSALAGRPSSACRSGVSRMALLCTPARFGRICAKPPAGVSLPTRHGSSPRSSSNCSAFHSPTPKPCAASPSLRWSTRSEYRRRLRPLPRSIDAQASGAAATGRTRSLA